MLPLERRAKNQCLRKYHIFQSEKQSIILEITILHLYHVASNICNRHSNAIMYDCNKHKTLFSNVPEINKFVVKVRWTIMFFLHFETCRNA